MDTTRTVISVVIPCYNQGHYLAQAVSSAASTAHRVETIVVDDGSTDDTPDVASRYPDVKYVRQQNRGLAAARNRGLEEAAGDLVVFLDADDRLLPDGIDIGARALAANPGCAMAYGRCVMIGPDGTEWPTPLQRRVIAGHHAVLLRTNPVWTPAMAIFRRTVLTDVGGFAPGFDASADYDLYLRIARAYPIHDHGHLVAAYRRHEASMSGSASRMLRDTLAVMERHRPDPGNAAQLDIWREGCLGWRDFYGTQLTEEIRDHVSRRELVHAFEKAWTLARYAPEILRREAGRKLRATLSRLPYAGRAIPAAEMSAPRRRADV
ncbi:MAG TPA: glycosyltransferase [Vicinamibacterales bacterium]|nr:glycosyltransferase [Vicinamibacterales bacterium]